jgi:heme/copper-type cytochrome/quinol oxidase subunit 2
MAMQRKLGQQSIEAIKWGVAVAALFLSPSALYAQSCAMCYQNAASSGAKLIAALRHGILIMLFPPLIIFGGIMGLAYSRRNSFAEHPEANADTGSPVEENNEIEIHLYD